MAKMPNKDPISLFQEAMEKQAEAKAHEAGAAVGICMAVLIDTLHTVGKMDQSDIDLFVQKLDAAIAKDQASPKPSDIVARVGLLLSRYLTKRAAN